LGAGVLQIAEVNTLSTTAADTTAIELVAAPAAGKKTFLRAVIVEKSAAVTPTFTLTSGTTTTTPCDTGTATVLGPVTPLQERIDLNIQIAAAKKLCGATDSADTQIRVLAQ
jgi:signal recognition particle receptor subunit beta